MRNSTDDGDKPSVAEEIASALLPAVVLMGALIVLGAVGNLLVCYVFFFRLRMTTQDHLISALAVFDMMTCVIAIPTEIVDMILFLTFDNGHACRLLKLINHFCVFCSILTLMAIAYNRYMMVCHPFKTQLTVMQVRQVVLLCTVTALVTAVPSAALYGIRTSNVTGLSEPAHDCSISDSMHNMVYPTIYVVVLNVMFFLCMITLAVAYTKILREIKSHKLRMLKHFWFIRSGSSPPESSLMTRLERSGTGRLHWNRTLEPYPTNITNDPDLNVRQRRIGHSLSTILSETFMRDTDEQDRLTEHSEGHTAPTDNTSPRECKQPCISIHVEGDEMTEEFTEAVIEVSMLDTKITDTSDKVEFLSPELFSFASNIEPSDASVGSTADCSLLDIYGQSEDEMVNRNPDSQTLPVEPSQKAGKRMNTNVNAQDDTRSEAYVSAPGTSALTCTQTGPADSTADRKSCATFPKCLLCIKTISDRLFCRSRIPGKEVAMSSPRTTVNFIRIGGNGRREANDTKTDKRCRVTHKLFTAKVESRKTTFLGIAITVGFFLSSIPHLILIAIRSLSPSYDRNLRGMNLTFYNIFLRSYFWHAIANPVIYGVFNDHFRKSSIQLFRQFQCCKRSDTDT